jgi:tyrosyl-tRNA synthetase
MNTKEKISLIKQNATEIINEEKLESSLKKKQPIVYCGYEPSGPLHIGHYVTILKLKDFENAGFKVKILLANWHAWLNNKGDWESLKTQAKIWKESFKKIGLKNPEIILGTSFQRKSKYFDDVFLLAANSTINRGIRAMQGVARNIEHAKVTQLLYPFMQVADMKHLNVDAVVAGMEQRKIHMIAVESLKDINYPVPTFVHTSLIPSLKGEETGKMSSSDKSGLISIADSSEEIKKKISKAYCPEDQPNPILDITKILIFPTYKKLKISRPEKFGGDTTYDSYSNLEKDFFSKKLHPMDLKKIIGEKLSEMFGKIR